MQIVYRNSSDEDPLPLEIPLCGSKFSIEKFKTIYRAIIPTGTFDEECQLPWYEVILNGGDISVSHDCKSILKLPVMFQNLTKFVFIYSRVHCDDLHDEFDVCVSHSGNHCLDNVLAEAAQYCHRK